MTQSIESFLFRLYLLSTLCRDLLGGPFSARRVQIASLILHDTAVAIIGGWRGCPVQVRRVSRPGHILTRMGRPSFHNTCRGVLETRCNHTLPSQLLILRRQ